MGSRKRSRQFTTRTIFALVLFASIPLARLGHMEYARLRLITDIEHRGGTVEAQPARGLGFFRGQNVTAVTLPHERTVDLDLEELRRFPNIKQLTLKDIYFRTPDGGELKSAGMLVHFNQYHDQSLNLLRRSSTP